MITLKEINAENLWDIIDLKVAPTQEEFVTSNAISIAQAKVQSECIPLAIYDDKVPVGFLMYCIDRDDDEYWIYRLMVDEKYQRKGYGLQALKLLLIEIKKDKARNKVFLGVDRRGIASVKLYEKIGFQFTGKMFGKESIMVLNY